MQKGVADCRVFTLDCATSRNAAMWAHVQVVEEEVRRLYGEGSAYDTLLVDTGFQVGCAAGSSKA